MSSLKQFYHEHKIGIQIGSFLLLLPFLLPIVNILMEILFGSGQIVGSYVRRLIEIGLC